MAGGVFLGLLAKFYWWPPHTMILPQVCALLIVLAILVILAMLMVRGAWREWRRYRMIADVARHRGMAPDAADRDKWRLVRDFFREKRP